MTSTLPILLCLASGFVIVCLGWPRQVPIASDLLLKTSLSAGYGLGIFSVVFFLSKVFGVTNLVVVDLLLLVLLVVALFLRTRASALSLSSSPPVELEGSAWFSRTLTAAFVIAFCTAIYSTVMRTLVHLHGAWDALAIWNLHARFLIRGRHDWHDGFSPLIAWSHPDYPLLLPAAVAHFWSYIGHDDVAVPALIGLVFTFSTLGLLCSALSTLRGHMPAMLGGIALLTTPFFLKLGTWQQADVPLSFFFLATVALLALHDDRAGGDVPQSSPGLLALAGLAAGFAAWTKNEGLLFLGTIIVARYVVIRRDSRRACPERNPILPEIAPLLSAVVPILLLIAYFKHSIAPPGDLFSDPKTMLHKLLEPARYIAVVVWFVKELLRFGDWLVPTTFLMVGYYFVVGREAPRRSDLALRSSVLALALTFAGYFATYLITPHGIYWHLSNSVKRLYVQLLPSTIFLFFLAVKNRSGEYLADPFSQGIENLLRRVRNKTSPVLQATLGNFSR
jgi:hypothetical protein